MLRRPPRSTRTDTLFPYTTLFRSKANPLSTPAHIVPEWYFWPFYAILRAFTVDFLWIPAKLWGVLAMFAAILLLFFLPWLDKSPVRSGSYRPLFKQFFWLLVIDVLILGYCGGAPAEEDRQS